ncbi:hypothetical protein AB0I28_06200 [Phytomonospora sp. NPDC050363]|uniref:hypothetical protein n=1 Tax=Phytomonospora sp. NPDC050363 TaxID=3155642 RepID=UPI00340E6F65
MRLDDALRRHGVHRVVEVRAGGRISSGYAVAADLVLTTRHGLRDAEAAEIRPLEGDPVPAEVVWRGSDAVDAAVLRVPSEPWRDDPGIAWTRWGEPEGDGVPVVARGFPKAKAAEGLRDLETMRGTVDRATGLAAGRLSADIRTPELLSGEEGYWRGMSGAVALAEPGLQILGVVAFDPTAYRGRRLELIPAAALLADPAFAELVSASALERVTARAPSTVDTRLIGPSVPLPAEHSDWQLLLPKYAVVPFQGREEARAGLLDWCRGSRPFDLAVITGEGGAGKTRLAAQLCAEIAVEGWDAGLIAETALKPAPEVLRPTLAVVDYAEPHAEPVGSFISAMNGRGHGPPVRLLLIARADLREGRWWRDLNARSEGVADHLRPPVAALNAAPLSTKDRRAHASAALTAFAAAPGTELPDLDAPEYAHPMRLHMAALLTARDEAPGSRASVLAQFLAREERLWLRAWSADPDEDDRILTTQAVALVALASPGRGEVGEILAALPDMDGPALRRLTRWIGTVFPGGEDRLVFGPDILTEELLDNTEGLHLLLTELIGATDDRARLARILDTATLAGASPRVRASLTVALRGHLARVAELALSDERGTLVPSLDTCLRMLTRDPECRPALNAACADVPDGIGNPFQYWPLRSTIAAGAVDRYKTLKDAENFAEQAADLATYWLHDGQIELADRVVDDALRTGHPVPLLHTNAAIVAFCTARPAEATEHIDEAVRLNDGDPGLLAAALINQAVVRSWRRDLHGAATSLLEASRIVGEDPAVEAMARFTAHLPPWEPGGTDNLPAGFLLHNRSAVPDGLPEDLRKAAVTLALTVVARSGEAQPDRQSAHHLAQLAGEVGDDLEAHDQVAMLETAVAFCRRGPDGDAGALVPGVSLVGARHRIGDSTGVLDELAWAVPAAVDAGGPETLLGHLHAFEAEALVDLGRHREAVAALGRAENAGNLDTQPGLRRQLLLLRERVATALGELHDALAFAEAGVELVRETVAADPARRRDLLFSLSAVATARGALGLDREPVATELASLWREFRDRLEPDEALGLGFSFQEQGLLTEEADAEWLAGRARAQRVAAEEASRESSELAVAASLAVLLIRLRDRLPLDAEAVAECRAMIEGELDAEPLYLAQLVMIGALGRLRAGDPAGARRELAEAEAVAERITDAESAAGVRVRVARVYAEAADPVTAKALFTSAHNALRDLADSVRRTELLAETETGLAALEALPEARD